MNSWRNPPERAMPVTWMRKYLKHHVVKKLIRAAGEKNNSYD